MISVSGGLEVEVQKLLVGLKDKLNWILIEDYSDTCGRLCQQWFDKILNYRKC